MKTMLIDQTYYKEAKAPKNWRSLPSRACTACHLHQKEYCSIALKWAAAEAFGGDCEERDVIYKVTHPPQ